FHRQISRRTPLRHQPWVFRGDKWIHEHLRCEDRAAGPCDEPSRQSHLRRSEKEQCGIDIGEVPVARRTASTAPGEWQRDQEQEGPGQKSGEEQLAPAVATRPRPQPANDQQGSWKIVRDQAEMTTRDEVREVSAHSPDDVTIQQYFDDLWTRLLDDVATE